MDKKGIVVVGSLNLDLVVHSHRVPSAGETLLGEGFKMHPGGKGANQAAGIGRLNYPVHMIGRVGTDSFGAELRESLHSAGVNTSAVSTSEGATGVAIIVVQDNGQNSIVVAPGANARLSADDLDANLDLIRNASYVLTQLETPIATLEHLSRICEQEKVPLILDPAPACPLPAEVLHRIAWITPNETEAIQLSGASGLQVPDQDLRTIAEMLLDMGPKNVILKLGNRGVYIATRDGLRLAVPSYPVIAVDTTAAGDAFNGAFSVGLARGARPLDAAQLATAAAALSVTRYGALPSMPTQAEVEAFMTAQQEMAL